MSDSGKRGEIEDVLTAIRRLLAQDGDGLEMRVQGERAAGERLMLTPELRVEQTDGRASIEDALALLEAAVAARASVPVPVESREFHNDLHDVDEAPFIAIDEPEHHTAEPIAFRQAQARRFQLVRSSFPPTTESDEPEFPVEAARPPVEVPSQPDAPPELPPDTPEESPPADIPEDPVEEPAEIPFDEPVETPPDVPDELPLQEQGATQTEFSAAADEVEVEAETYLPEEVRPGREAANISSATLPDVEDDIDLFADETSELGDEHLRMLVAEVLREELQGPLGERMTRNVRKLVRAEIRKALAGREFE
ncbi:hypothetical protein CDV50_05790 [Haematobacter massiliensis]|uniref:Uncharacterized protein n=1 Tax=Haematobacter massiliensis TaxID=195105 RepID=A0A086YD87_9RHOB|nr:hypothetical protein [Haematobacter massiliensis]KFI32237.1 hypothetical protein CN97_06535 [Haematobacter massiliensis]OWJ72666.1 hypothetical protein CDV50_05790 [Haematobacter massiliensis]OWJ86805.1 hypothetical protein CDV51_09765 [Haematobacter massiliensis]QBJ24448.1 hypothetical protein HmaOT1_09380 [Haematobacter massiliensis]